MITLFTIGALKGTKGEVLKALLITICLDGLFLSLTINI